MGHAMYHYPAYNSLLPKVCNHEVHLLCMLAVSEYDLDLLHDGSVLVQSSINIMDWNWVWQRGGFQRMLLGGGGTAGGNGDTGSCFFLGVSVLSDVPCIGCDLVGYLQ